MEVKILDLEFQGIEQVIAAFLVQLDTRIILVESGPYSTYANLQKALALHGVGAAEVTDVLLTHIHFDHAGAAWQFAQLGARIHVHPLGLKHLHNPERLWNSAAQIYGEDGMEMLWGKMESIHVELLQVWEDRQEESWDGVRVTALHTPGHAKHHITWCVEQHLFAGDVAGVCIGEGPVEPPCPPPDIDLEAWQLSIKHMRRYANSCVATPTLYLTHFGKVQASWWDHLDVLAKTLMRWGETSKALLIENQDAFEEKFVHFIEKERETQDQSTVSAYLLANPASMSAPGIKRYWSKKELNEN